MKGVLNPKDPMVAMPSETATSTAASVKPTSLALLRNTAWEVSRASLMVRSGSKTENPESFLIELKSYM